MSNQPSQLTIIGMSFDKNVPPWKIAQFISVLTEVFAKHDIKVKIGPPETHNAHMCIHLSNTKE